MTPTKAEIKPCPFCGKKPDIYKHGGYECPITYGIQCCIMKSFHDKDDAIQAWNRRTET